MKLSLLIIVSILFKLLPNNSYGQVLQEKIVDEFPQCSHNAKNISFHPFHDDKYLITSNPTCSFNTDFKSLIVALDRNLDTLAYKPTSFKNIWLAEYGTRADSGFFIIVSEPYLNIKPDSFYLAKLSLTNDFHPLTGFRPGNCSFEEGDYYSGPNTNIIATNYKQGACTNYKDALISCFDFDYNLKWEFRFEGAKNDEIRSIKRLADKSVLALGHSNSKLTHTNLFLLKLDSLGAFKSNFSISDSLNSNFSNDLEIDSSGNVYIAWNKFNQLYLTKLNRDLEFQWEIPLNTYGLNDIELQFSENDNSLVLISNGINPISMGFEQKVNKISVRGDLVWERDFSERIADFLIKPDGSFLFYGDDDASGFTKIIHFDSSFAYYTPIDSSFIPNSDSSVVEPVVSISNIDAKTGLKIYPNPFSDYVSISSDGMQIKKYAVYSLVGQLLEEEAVNSNQKTIKFKNKHLAGTYIIQVELEDGTLKTDKIIYRN